jgi:predicted esterase
VQIVSRSPDGGKGIAYRVQLPPEYHPSRAYPLLVVLHRGDEKPEEMLGKWSELAGRYGFILAAPDWEKGLGGGGYAYTAKEHTALLDCLWDLRRRFQVDSDRVFLFGAGAGGLMAYDVGLAHPDQFAGVAVMSAYPQFFATRYAPNAQFLPFYVVDGDKDVRSSDNNQKIANRWVRWHFPALLVEYRGRGREWFAAEPPVIMDWMSRKKRIFPQQELGRHERGDTFVSMRATDDRFYWLSSDAIQEYCLNDAAAWNPAVRPATFQGRIGSNFIHLHVSGLKKVSVWLGPGMVNFDQPARIQIGAGVPFNRPVQPSLETLLEDLYQRGDRQQLFVARIDLKL